MHAVKKHVNYCNNYFTILYLRTIIMATFIKNTDTSLTAESLGGRHHVASGQVSKLAACCAGKTHRSGGGGHNSAPFPEIVTAPY